MEVGGCGSVEEREDSSFSPLSDVGGERGVSDPRGLIR